jgi:hypothetical protein
MALKEVAIGKRAQLDKASQRMFLAVCAASVVLGLALVGSIFFIKWMVFNGKVISRKDQIISDYKTIQSNVNVLSQNIIGSDTVPGLANNANLEVIARARGTSCVSIDGTPVDTEDDVELARICSALRVIPDALPSVRNDEAAYASLNKLFLLTKDENGQPVEPESIAPGSNNPTTDNSGLSTIPVSLSIKNTSTTARAVLDTIERSIRNYDIRSATIAWRSSDGINRDQIELRGTAVAYYSLPVEAVTKTEIIYADDSNRPTAGGTTR